MNVIILSIISTSIPPGFNIRPYNSVTFKSWAADKYSGSLQSHDLSSKLITNHYEQIELSNAIHKAFDVVYLQNCTRSATAGHEHTFKITTSIFCNESTQKSAPDKCTHKYIYGASRSTTLYAFLQGALSSNAAQKCTLQLRATRPKWDVFLLGMMEWGGRRGALAKSRSRPRNAGHQSIYRSRLEPRLKSNYMVCVCVCSRLEVVRLQWINNHLKLMIGYLRQAIYEYIYIVRMNTRGERNYDEGDQDLCEAPHCNEAAVMCVFWFAAGFHGYRFG